MNFLLNSYKQNMMSLSILAGMTVARFDQVGFIIDPVMVSKFRNKIHESKGLKNKIYTIIKDQDTFYGHQTVTLTSCSKVKHVLKMVIPWKQRIHQRIEGVQSNFKFSGPE